MLCLSDELGCTRSRDVLLQLAACEIHRLSSLELSELSPGSFTHLITAVCQNSQQQEERRPAAAASQARLYTTVGLKKSSWVFFDIFHKRLGIFSPNFTRRSYIYATIKFFYSVVCNFDEVMPC